MKKYFLNYYVGGFVDTYITEEIELDDTKELFIYFIGKNYSHIHGKAININAFEKMDKDKIYEVILENRLAYIMEVESWKEEELKK